MKRLRKWTITFFVTAMFICNAGVCVSAADSTITFHGDSAGFDFNPGSEYTQTDLFDNFKNAMPGDKLTETITVTNKASDCDYVKLYMRAVAHDENGNPLTYDEAFEASDGKDQTGVEGQRDETVATMADFLAQLSMRVYKGESLIYDASPDELGGLTENVFLDTLRHGENVTLTVELVVPLELGNDYANRVGEVDWIFTSESFDDPEPEPEVPTELPTDRPHTGDDSNIALYVMLAVLCVVIGAILMIRQKKNVDKNRKEQRKE